jgi:hypothetical protein
VENQLVDSMSPLDENFGKGKAEPKEEKLTCNQNQEQITSIPSLKASALAQ